MSIKLNIGSLIHSLKTHLFDEELIKIVTKNTDVLIEILIAELTKEGINDQTKILAELALKTIFYGKDKEIAESVNYAVNYLKMIAMFDPELTIISDSIEAIINPLIKISSDNFDNSVDKLKTIFREKQNKSEICDNVMTNTEITEKSKLKKSKANNKAYKLRKHRKLCKKNKQD